MVPYSPKNFIKKSQKTITVTNSHTVPTQVTRKIIRTLLLLYRQNISSLIMFI